MRFLKEYIIVFLIIVFVILIEIITDNITNQSISKIKNEIQELEKCLETEDVDAEIKKLCDLWKKQEEKLSYYMEHNELEKISILVDNVNSNIQTDSKEEINEQVNEIKFMLDHVKDKQKLELKNIF